MPIDETSNDNKIINFQEGVRNLISKSTKEEIEDRPATSEELLTMGIDAFLEQTEECQAFITIVFDKENNPSTVHAGDLDLINSIGALEYAKNQLLNSNFLFNIEDVQEQSDDYTNDTED